MWNVVVNNIEVSGGYPTEEMAMKYYKMCRNTRNVWVKLTYKGKTVEEYRT